MTRSTINNNNDCCNTTNSFCGGWKKCSDAGDRSQILAWLSSLEPRVQHREIQERRVDDVGEWLIQTEEFQIWCGLDGESEDYNPVLFCYGDPGVGKTFISSLVVDRLCDQSRGQNTAVGCFYIDFEVRKDQSAASILGSLLRQLVSGIESIPEEISHPFQEQKMAIGGRILQLPDIVKMLQFITSSQPTFMCIDALDECEGVQRFKLLDSLSKILEKSPHTRIFLTGRPHIRDELEKGLSQRVVSVSISPTKGDITRYLRARLDEDETPDAMDRSLEADILEKIFENNISETFLLASLYIEPILRESTIYRRRKRLCKMTEELDLRNVYGSTIKRIKAQDGDKFMLGMAALMWIIYAERPLRVDELCHSLAVEIGSRDFNTDNIPSISTVVSCCQGLIAVDEEASTVRLINVTLQEYLSSDPEIFPIGKSHSEMAEICLTYLNSQQVKALSTVPSPDILDTSFLEYCSIYWGVHAKWKLSIRARSLAAELLQEYDGHVSAGLLLKQAKNVDLSSFGPNSRFSGLHCASFFGIVQLVAVLTERGSCDINGRDFGGYTPLSWASRNGHEDVVKYLLARQRVNAEISDNYGLTPLSYAIQYGHQGVEKILLGLERVNPEKRDSMGRTPLELVFEQERAAIIKHYGCI